MGIAKDAFSSSREDINNEDEPRGEEKDYEGSDVAYGFIRLYRGMNSEERGCRLLKCGCEEG